MMHRIVKWRWALALSAMLAIQSAGSEVAAAASHTSLHSLKPFETDNELLDFLHRARSTGYCQGSGDLEPQESVIYYHPRRWAPVQESAYASVEAAGVVKPHGKQVLMLHRDTLFSLDASTPRLRAISSTSVFPPWSDGNYMWREQLLVMGDRALVIGSSFFGSRIDIAVVDIASDGKLTYRDTYSLQSAEFCASGRFAARVVGGKLVVYSSFTLPSVGQDSELNEYVADLPRLHKWRESDEPGALPDKWPESILPTRAIYHAPEIVAEGKRVPLVMHVVTTCDFTATEPECKATAAIAGDSYRGWNHVSPEAVYVWTAGSAGAREPAAKGVLTDLPGMLLRVPFDGSAPRAIGVLGVPANELSVRESGDGYIDVAVHADEGTTWLTGDGLVNTVITLLRIPFAELGDGTRAMPLSAYRRLPAPPLLLGPAAGPLTSRFVGDQLVYGSSDGTWDTDEFTNPELYVVEPRTGRATLVRLPHDVERIEALGDDALAIGTKGQDLQFSLIRLGRKPARLDGYVLKGKVEGDVRLEGVFYSGGRHGSGVLALPVLVRSKPDEDHLVVESSVVFLRRSGNRLSELGELQSLQSPPLQDAELFHRGQWYGNAGASFLHGRLFGVMGYEIVEGRIEGDRLREVGRVQLDVPPAMAALCDECGPPAE